MDSTYNLKTQKKIGIALSGGGARGIAHIGVLQALEEHGIFPEVIAGTSAGAIAGALYAAGRSPLQILEFVKKTSLLKAIRLGLPTKGLTNLGALVSLLAEQIPENDFAGLQKPLYLAVSNLSKGCLEFVHTGKLFETVVASCSIPLVFRPVELDGAMYVDGGLMCNLPAEAIREECELLIGVNVMPIQSIPNKDMGTVIGIANRTFELSILTNTTYSRDLCDVTIEPPELRDYNIFNFRKVKELYEVGYAAAQDKIAEIKSAMPVL